FLDRAGRWIRTLPRLPDPRASRLTRACHPARERPRFGGAVLRLPPMCTAQLSQGWPAHSGDSRRAAHVDELRGQVAGRRRRPVTVDRCAAAVIALRALFFALMPSAL